MSVMQDILVEHLEEIEFLWTQRQAALRSVEYQRHEVQEIESRLAAHLEGVRVGGEQAIALASEMLTDDDPDIAFAGAWSLLHLDAGSVILDSIAQSNLAGVSDALCQGPIDSIADQLTQIYENDSPQVASAVGVPLAAHGQALPGNRLEQLLCDDDPSVRRRGWTIVALQSDTV
ncbi:hypothetical protein NHH03_05140 [Stieleria sp. TO1_6]|uniref:hypothetical protein n=1 Tax=Stieleria tagensis TaxID=2956795 RepID=UPI00209BB50C|nr:hypothetical protein [Stieleria tagensis]MCO8121114.1 hypothetical protein [Stieleria tagensis]